MSPEPAIKLYKQFNEILRNEYNMVVEEGIFGAHMILDPICDGPVTIELEF
jgi:D-tyrosyl-tRNA(Tyr) deacylase